MNENTIIVDQFLGVGFVDVYVRDGKELAEIEQGVSLAEMYQLINRFKNEYGINRAVFNEYDENEECIKNREITL